MNNKEFNILLIDHDEADYNKIKNLLENLPQSNFQITWCSSYQNGFIALYEKKFDACLLSYNFSSKAEIDLLNFSNIKNLSCPVIILTEVDNFEIDLQAMQSGASDYLSKKFLTSNLLERSLRYSMKHAIDMEELREIKAQVLQQDRLSSLGLLASSLAHEIGTPLAIIRGRSELTSLKNDSPNIKKDMDIIVSQIDRITKIVNSLLNLSRKTQPELTATISLNRVIEDILKLTKHELDKNNITFEIQIKNDFYVKAEYTLLGQVLLNLLMNSIHAIEEEKKSGSVDQHKINLKVVDKNELIEISIFDNGCGIPKENLPHIFKPFFTTKDVGLGTGLGLATAYKIIQSWGGSITLQSELGIGTTFTIDLIKSS